MEWRNEWNYRKLTLSNENKRLRALFFEQRVSKH